ncbi:MAG TPA: hypothetical protein RMH99_04200 [Sandaracinaceae bacterium LLY-WYZ-13_1]|nr:hypothetical protein [Sandaracinaceae bacterium LLY-WYZ-13_1]
MGIGVISLLTAAYFTTGERVLSERLPPNGGMVGPIQIAEPNTVLNIHVNQSLNLPSGRSSFGTNSTWSFVSGEVLDAEQEYLFGFGGELWKESGYDGTHWTESKDDYELKVTIPDAGTFFLEFSTELPPGATNPGEIRVAIEKKRGSAIPHFIFGIVAILLGLIMRFFASKAVQTTMGMSTEGA